MKFRPHQPRIRLLASVFGLVAPGCAVLAPSAGASPDIGESSSTWSLVGSANAVGRIGSLEAVSCMSAADCVAVGNYTNSAGDEAALAIEWSGKAWSTKNIAIPPSASASSLDSVACVSTSCTAVGGYTKTPGDRVPLTERWNGSKWSIASVSGLPGATLTAVSCASISACEATGNYTNPSTGLETPVAAGWNGSRWASQTVPNPAPMSGSDLVAISCTKDDACTAVGGYALESGHSMLAEVWNGSKWSRQAMSSPDQASLSGVSCVSPMSCVAVGYNSNTPASEVWNGSHWTLVLISEPVEGVLSGVACRSATTCVAVGYYGKTERLTVSETWNGKTWSVRSKGSRPGSLLAGVSCVSTADCRAVGVLDKNLTLAQSWNGVTWSTEATPTPSGAAHSYLAAVSCTSAPVCAANTGRQAVGYSYLGTTSTRVVLAEGWNGTKWVTEPTEEPSGATSSALSGVSCSSATSCTAVGQYTTPTDVVRTLAEVWNGSKWTVQATPNPPGATYSILSGVSCASAQQCVAVGYYMEPHSSDVALAEARDASSWSVESVPPSPDPNAQAYWLTSVSCTSSEVCMGVGAYYSSDAGELGAVPLAEQWTGGVWNVVSPTYSVKVPTGPLSAVSCSGADSCIAVGFTYNGNYSALAETWNGSKWTVDKTAATGAQAAVLTGVWCTSKTRCVAVGDDSFVKTNLTLTEAYNDSSWSLQPSPNPKDATDSSLAGVVCTAAPECTAVGQARQSSGSVTLIERYSQNTGRDGARHAYSSKALFAR
jgi:hypothetical protein